MLSLIFIVKMNLESENDETKDFSTTKTSINEYNFKIDDYNLIGYSKLNMGLICDYRLIVETRFPKLVVVLYNHPKFNEWLNLSEYNEITDNQKIECILKTIQKYCFNFQGNLIHRTIDLNDSLFWQILVDNIMIINEKNKSEKLGEKEINNLKIDSENKNSKEEDKNINEKNELDTKEKLSPLATYENEIVKKINKSLKSYRFWKQNNQPSLYNTKKRNTKQRSVWIE